jgi:hypothetical protein
MTLTLLKKTVKIMSIMTMLFYTHAMFMSSGITLFHAPYACPCEKENASMSMTTYFNGHRGHGYFCLICIQMILLNIPQTIS